MSFESDLHTAVTGESSISALVASRLYPLHLPQEPTLPAITFQRISDQSDEDLDGGAGLDGVRVQFDIYSSVHTETVSVRNALQSFLQGFKGAMGSTQIESIHYLDDTDSYEPDVRLYRSSIDFEIWHQR